MASSTEETKHDKTKANIHPKHKKYYNPNQKCVPMPSVMVGLSNIGGALCSTPQSMADAHYLTAVQ